MTYEFVVWVRTDESPDLHKIMEALVDACHVPGGETNVMYNGPWKGER